MADPGIGQLSLVTGDGLAQSSAGLTHTSPKPADNGQIAFQFAWRAPNQPGAVHFAIYGNAANDDGTPNGDAPGWGLFSYTFGCTPQTFYFDADGDGYGAEAFPPTLGCANQPPPIGYSANHDDCDDAHDGVHPGAVELCNGRDDNCDGAIDEGAKPQQLWPDEDGDGYYADKTATPVIGCLPLAGYAADPGDCAPRDAARHPGATEVCNLLDDNCNGRIDEGLRPQCGVGFCRRQSVTCDFADCVPGVPATEVCNLADDNCDGQIDEGDICPKGTVCTNGQCVPGTFDAGSGGTGDSDVSQEPAADNAAGCSMSAGRPYRWPWAAAIPGFLLVAAGHLRRRNSRRVSCCTCLAMTITLAVAHCSKSNIAASSMSIPPSDAQQSASGLVSKVLARGVGDEHPEPSDRVRVHYTGWLRDGTEFDSSRTRGEPGLFTVMQTIAGWAEALATMVAGEQRRLWIPARLGYGQEPMPGVPAGDLIYDIELVEIIRSPKPPEDVEAPPRDASVTKSGLAYRVLIPGSGSAHPSPIATVTIAYSGWTRDALLFDSSILRGGPMSFALDAIIKGLSEGIELMVIGEKARFWIPAHLAYGEHPTQSDTPAGMLVYDVELQQIH